MTADNDWQKQVLMNEPVFAALEGAGEDLSDTRHVVHYFYDGDVEGLSAALKAQGFDIRPTATSPGVIAETHAATDRAWSETEMKRMCDLANQFGAEYDGWEGSMVRQGSGNAEGSESIQ
jgi:hypothetical protein